MARDVDLSHAIQSLCQMHCEAEFQNPLVSLGSLLAFVSLKNDGVTRKKFKHVSAKVGKHD